VSAKLLAPACARCGREFAGRVQPSPEDPARCADPDDCAQNRLGLLLRDLERAVLAVIDQAHPEISEGWRTAVLADALAVRELEAADWCVACKLSHGDPLSQICADHDRGVDLADEVRRHVYRRLGAVVMEDLHDPERRLRIVRPEPGPEVTP
jgi:hypothetical protein